MSNTMTPTFTVSYPKVFKPEVNKLSGETEYSLVALFPKGSDLTALKKAAQEAIEKKFGAKAKNADFLKTLRNPFRDQGEKAKVDETTGKSVLPQGHEAGAIYMNLKSKQKPQVVDQNVQLILEPTDFYAGCKARATVRAYAYDNKGNKGVAFGLVNVQKVSDGEALGGRTRAEDDFTPIAGATDAAASDASSLFG